MKKGHITKGIAGLTMVGSLAYGGAAFEQVIVAENKLEVSEATLNEANQKIAKLEIAKAEVLKETIYSKARLNDNSINLTYTTGEEIVAAYSSLLEGKQLDLSKPIDLFVEIRKVIQEEGKLCQ